MRSLPERASGASRDPTVELVRTCVEQGRGRRGRSGALFKGPTKYGTGLEAAPHMLNKGMQKLLTRAVSAKIIRVISPL